MAFEKVWSLPKVAGPPVLRGYHRQDKIITLEASPPVGSIRGGGLDKIEAREDISPENLFLAPKRCRCDFFLLSMRCEMLWLWSL